ncbi:MAG: NAD(P)/FAD-dependent oxidoreductase [Thermoproteus sp. AZ2]|uniref:NAD(P)/FAD-dependent oxidoreductase n=1 Tax=Thermoproteus sp. AZ2 TaxID=1609232 RepID=A0ACC6V1W0_9CREN|nr:MAG: pyridine nucleotide-disulfide oxidoreductase [Thermoproteus sp. AZ2]
MRVVIAGGGISGVYFAYKLLQELPDAEVLLIEPKDYHEFTMGIPMAFAGLVEFKDLKMPLSSLRRIRHIKDQVVAVEPGGFRISSGELINGDYKVLAIGSLRVGHDDFYTVEGAENTYRLAASADVVRFIVDEAYPVMGFQEVAIAVKSVWKEKKVYVHVLYIHDDYRWLFNTYKDTFDKYGVALTEDPPPIKTEGRELHLFVPELAQHPLARGLRVTPLFETQHPRTYLIGESSLMKLGLPPIGWGAIWQASALAHAIATEAKTGVAEYAVEEWSAVSDPDKFRQFFTYRMTRGVPLVSLKGLYDLWRNSIFASL